MNFWLFHWLPLSVEEAPETMIFGGLKLIPAFGVHHGHGQRVFLH